MTSRKAIASKKLHHMQIEIVAHYLEQKQPISRFSFQHAINICNINNARLRKNQIILRTWIVPFYIGLVY